MAAVLEQLPAVATLLQSVKHAPCFGQIAVAQRISLEQLIGLQKLEVSEAAAIIKQLQAMPWDQNDLNALLESVARASATAVSTSPASKLQNFEPFDDYFTEQHWALFRDSAATDTKMHTLLQHLSMLGLRFPTESTVQRVVAFYLAITEGFAKAADLSPQVKLDTVRFFKKKIKEYGKEPPKATVSALPVDARTFARMYPSVASTVFGDAAACKSKLDASSMHALVQSVPMRSTHKAMKETKPTANPFEAMFMKMFSSMGMQPAAPGDIPIKLLQPPRRALSAPSFGDGGASSSTPTSVPSLGVTRPKPIIDVGDWPEVSEPISHEGRVPLPIMDGSVKSSVDEVTDKILAGLVQRKTDGTVKKTAEVKAGKKGKPKSKAKAKGKAKAAATTKPKVESKAKAPKTAMKATKGTFKPAVGIEWSRSRVQARTGLAGPGQNKAFKFNKESEMPEAKRKAEKWLRDQGCFA